MPSLNITNVDQTDRNTVPTTEMNFERTLEICGNFNRYQFLLLVLFGYLNLMVSMHYFAQTIISFVPEQHWCYHEKLENKTFEEIEEIYSRFENPSCIKLADIVNNVGIPSNESCDKWIYNYEFGYESMTTELNWVCDSAHKSTIGQSIFFVGSVLGTLLYGGLSDRIGRVPTIIISNLSGFLGDFLTIFTKSVPMFSICRFISGMAADSNYYLMYIMVMEYMRPSMRTFALNIGAGVFYSMGLVAVPWIAVGVGNWKYFLMCTSIPLASVIAFYFLIQESAQWLITRNEITKAVVCLKNVAKFNKRIVSDEVFHQFENYYKQQKALTANQKKDTFLRMFKTPRLRKLTFILFFKSIVITLGYDVVSRNVEGLGVSSFVMFSVTSIALLPCVVTMIALQDRIGRKAMAAGSIFLGGVFTTATGIIIAYEKGKRDPILLGVMTFIARYGVNISYESGAQYATELIPACVRGQGVGIVHVTGYGMTFLSPYIIYLGTFFKPLPSLILGILLFIGSYTCLMLPETVGRKLPETLAEGEEFGRGEGLFDFPCNQKNKTRKDDTEQYEKSQEGIDNPISEKF